MIHVVKSNRKMFIKSHFKKIRLSLYKLQKRHISKDSYMNKAVCNLHMNII